MFRTHFPPFSLLACFHKAEKFQDASIFKHFLSGRKIKLTSGPLWRTRHESNMHSTRSEMFEKSSNMFSSVLASTTRAFCEMSVLKKCFRPLSGCRRCLVKAFCLLCRFCGRHECKAIREIIANGLALCSTSVIFCVIMVPKCSDPTDGRQPSARCVRIDNCLHALSSVCSVRGCSILNQKITFP